MNFKSLYSQYIREQNLQGSNKATSYIRALDLLAKILAKSHSPYQNDDFWSIASVDKIAELYKYALTYQKKDESEFITPELPPSYGRNGYYSAALNSYKEFLIIHQHKELLWNIFEDNTASPTDLSKCLQAKRVKAVKQLFSDKDYDFSKKEGKDKLREVKTRINQEFFRGMILKTYQSQCCITGLNIPEVLRASHIIPWAEDADNRLNPENGVCLSATYDAAFDRHLISFDEDYRLIFSPNLEQYYSNKAFQAYFVKLEGKQITLPKLYAPNQEFLERHRQKCMLHSA